MTRAPLALKRELVLTDEVDLFNGELGMNTRINKITAFVLALALGPVVANAQVVQWTTGPGANDHFYERIAVTPGTSWDDARALAEAEIHNGAFGYLATITSADEDAFIRTNGSLNTGGGEVWLGGFQMPCESPETDFDCGWEWINGEGPFVYTNWTPGEPNNTSGGAEDHLGTFLGSQSGWNDEGAFGNITGILVEFAVDEVFVEEGEDEVFIDGANDPASPHGVSAGYQEVLEAGNWSIKCCTVEDWREGAGSGKKFGAYLPTSFDIGVAIDLAAAGSDLACQDLQVYGGVFGAGKAKLHPWQRAVPNPAAGTRTGARFGVCLVRSEVIAQGVLFTAEEPANVLGYPVNCKEPQIDDRPYTSGVAILPTDVNSPYAVRESADCNRSRSGKRSSDRLVVLNEWHYTKHKKTQPYLSMIAASLKQVIDDERTRMPACVSNAEGYLDDLTSLVQEAKNEMKKKGDHDKAEDALNEATRLALLIPTVLVGSPSLPTSDPYFSSTSFCLANNAQGLIAGRLMALKFANCSENLHPGDSSSSSDGECEIEPDILAEMPPIP